MWKFGANIKIVTYKLQTILKEAIYYETTISMAFHGNKGYQRKYQHEKDSSQI